MAVFGVKYRLGLIAPAWQRRLYAVMGQTLSEMEGVKPIEIGGVKDHVHVLFSTKGNIAESEIIRKLKSESSLWINQNKLTIGRFAWQNGGGRFNYSHSALNDVIRYIRSQEEHHRHKTFREEYEGFLRKLNREYSCFDLPEDLK